MQTILITGGHGLLGSRIRELLQNDFHFLVPTSQELNITNQHSVENYLSTHAFDKLLHLAAYTNVDKAETEKELCYAINVEGTKNVFELTQHTHKPFILVSTDFVFAGNQEPYIEKSVPQPLGYYGQTKYLAEQIVLNQGMIIRPSYPYRANFAPKKDFMRGILSLLEQGTTIQGITNALITPTFIDDIAHGLKILLNKYQPEVYHLVGANTLSPYDAFQQIAQTFNLSPKLIVPTTYESYFKNKAPRPQYSEIINSYSWLPMHSFQDGLNLVKEALA